MMQATRSPIYSHHAARSKYEMFAADNATCSAASVAVRSLYRVRAPFCCSELCRCVLYTNRIDEIILLLLLLPLLLWKDAISSQDGIHCGVILTCYTTTSKHSTNTTTAYDTPRIKVSKQIYQIPTVQRPQR